MKLRIVRLPPRETGEVWSARVQVHSSVSRACNAAGLIIV